MTLRRLTAVFFLALILCQIGGYYGVMEFLKNQMLNRTAQRIVTEKEPIGGQLILRIPITSSEQDVRDPYFTFEGSVYHVIDRHVYDNTLYIVCLRSDQETTAQQSIESFAQSMAGKPGDEGSSVKFFENLSKYFFSEQYSTGTVATGWMLEQHFPQVDSFYSFDQSKRLFHPPSVI